jgi:hypothetical protein
MTLVIFKFLNFVLIYIQHVVMPICVNAAYAIAILQNNYMNFKDIIFTRLSISVCFVAFNMFQSCDAKSNSSELEFFKGNWECKLQTSPSNTFQWLVREENSWLNGSVQRGQNKVSTDFWRITNGKIERFAFASDGLLVKVESNGWESNKLVFLGSFNKQNEVSQVRETITRKTDKEFRAIWEKMERSRHWVTITDERCTKS